jgi:hydrogenase expression/formation protein HypE
MSTPDLQASCPIPITEYPRVLMAHGGGGRLMHQLLERIFITAFGNPILLLRHDSAQLTIPPGRLALTTDSYVVRPLFFPGGDIGSLAVHGTVNDLAMSGARPLYLTSAFILEEGLPMETLWRIVCSMSAAARLCGAQIVTGDTKVVDKGKGDGLFINTTGLGVIETSLVIAPESVRPGDAILVNGDLGRHGMAIMALREGLEFESRIESDSAPVHQSVLALLAEGVAVHCLRDLTRGGLTSALNEIAQTSHFSLDLEEACVPVRPDVRAACEILGLDPMLVACEGRFTAFVPQAQVRQAISLLRDQAPEADIRQIGRVTSERSGRVYLRSTLGGRRILDMPGGEQLPRIC